MIRSSQWVSDQSGSSVVEFALLLFPLTMLVFGIIHTGLILYAVQQLNFATEATARCLVTAQNSSDTAQVCKTTSSATTYFQTLYKGPTATPSLTTLNGSNTCNSSGNYQVVAETTYKIRAVLVRLDVPLVAKACFPH